MNPKLSIVTTLYQSAPYIVEFHQRARAAARELVGDEYEIIFVNDGSPDNSLDIAVQLVEADSHVTVVDLSRNFGHHKAIMTGLQYAKGDYVFLIDSDLEEDPELLSVFYEKLLEDKCDVIFGVVAGRKKSWLRGRLSSIALLFYKMISGIKSPRNQATVRLMSQRYVKSLLEFSEQELFLEGIFYLVGYKQDSIAINKKFRNSSSYSLKKRADLFINAMCSFSERPPLFVFFIGCFILFFSFFSSLYFVFKKIYMGSVMPGWVSVMLSSWFLGGVVISCLGIIALYLSKMFIEIKSRPISIIQAIYINKK
jgi:putative glycosyltransferase